MLFKRKLKKKLNDNHIPSPPATSKYAKGKKNYGADNNLITEKKNGYVYVTEVDNSGKKLWKFKYKPPNFQGK